MNNNIPHLLHVFPSFGRGGIPIQISHAINYFGDKARHTIISTNDDYGAKEVLNAELDVSFPNLDHLAEGGLLKRLKNYQRYLKDTKPDAFSALTAKSSPRIPAVFLADILLITTTSSIRTEISSNNAKKPEAIKKSLLII